MRAIVALMLVFGCGAAHVQVPPERVVRSGALPHGYEAVGRVVASCDALDGARSFDGEPLDHFDCNRARLERVLAERASEASAEMLVGTSCGRDGRTLRCTATAARAESEASRLAWTQPDPGPVPGPAAIERWDEPRASAAEAIAIDFELAGPAAPRRARRATDVREAAALPVSHRGVGVLTARCDADECSPRELRQALRIAAGALGASDLVAVRCFERDRVRECVADAATPYVDE
jgi:hypothetical protein